jgi:hypothetical protein
MSVVDMRDKDTMAKHVVSPAPTSRGLLKPIQHQARLQFDQTRHSTAPVRLTHLLTQFEVNRKGARDPVGLTAHGNVQEGLTALYHIYTPLCHTNPKRPATAAAEPHTRAAP